MSFTPDFSLISFDSDGIVETKNNLIDLRNFFNALIDKKKLKLTPADVENIIVKDLEIVNYEARMLSILIDAFRYYVIVWPGWYTIKDDDPAKYEHYQRIKQYLIFKCVIILQEMLTSSNQGKAIPTAELAVQTECERNASGCKLDTPFALRIRGPPTCLNNLVFVENDGNIIVRQYLPQGWAALTQTQFLNWPHVGVEVNVIDVKFYRYNVHKADRHLSLHNDVESLNKVEPISYIDKVNANTRKVFSYNFMAEYFKEFLEFVKIIDVNSTRVEELHTIVTQFLEDIKETDLCDTTVCTGTKVGFNIGKKIYIRNKKIVSQDKWSKTSQNTVNFFETFIPQIEYMLQDASMQQDLTVTTKVSFVNIGKLKDIYAKDKKSKIIEFYRNNMNNSSIIYHCLLCKLSYSGENAYQDVTKHFQYCHKKEQKFLCPSCFKQMECTDLSETRWSHRCVKGRT